MQNMSLHQRRGIFSASILMAGATACQTAAAYDEFGYYSGAYAAAGISGCRAAVGRDVTPKF
jgi:hypothetical protein